MTQHEGLERLNYIINKLEPITDQELEELRSVAGTSYVGGSATFIMNAQLKVTVELIVAIKRFDNTSAELVKTTNVLTKRVFWLTLLAIVLALIQVAEGAISLFSSK